MQASTRGQGGTAFLRKTSFLLWQRAVLFSVAYFVCAVVGSRLSVRHGTYVSFWLPAGLYVAVLLLHDTRSWRWLILAAFFANLVFDLLYGTPVVVMVLFFSATTVQAVTGAWLVRRFAAERPTLSNLKEFAGLLVLAATLSPLLGAAIGAPTMVGFGLGPSMACSYRIWWGSHATAILVLAPFILTWFSGSPTQDPHFRSPKKLLEAALLFCVLITLTGHLLVLDEGILSPNKGRMLLPLLWAGLRFGPRGAAAANLTLALVGTFFTTHFSTGLRPEQISSGQALFTLHTSLAVAALVGLIPAIVLAERDRTTAELRDSETRLRTLTDASFEGIGVCKDGTIVDANDQLLRMLGYTRSELVGKPVIELIAPESRELVLRMNQAPSAQPYEHLGLRKDGTVFPVEACTRIIASQPHVVRLTAVRDITERKLAEAALRASEESLRATIEHTPLVAVQWYDAGGRVLYWNQASESMYGWTAAEAVGKQLSQLMFAPDEARAFELALLEIGKNGKPIGPVEFAVRRRDGSPGAVLSTVFRIPVATGVLRFARMDVDVTERKRAEMDRARLEGQLHQAQKMQSLGTLAGGIAHDFNNILTAILGNTELAIADVGPGHPARQSLEQVEIGARRASELVRRILTFSRQQEVHRNVIKLQPVIEEASNLLRSSLPPKIRIRTQFADAVPYVRADPTQIHQVVMNLGTNAAHAIGERSGLIEIRLDVVAVDSSQTFASQDLRQGLYVRLSVGDDGCGMDKTTLERMFEPFFTTKSPGQGSGLGLSVVHGIVKRHEGVITVESQRGQGTTFQLYFPVVSDPKVEPAMARPEVQRGRNQRILYVDDEEPIISLATRILNRIGYQISGFTDPTLAVQTFLLRPYDFDAVVTDLSMPKMSGADLTAQIMKVRPEIPVIMTSGFIRPQDMELARTLGVADLILKPNTIEELSRILHQLLVEKKRSFQPPATG